MWAIETHALTKRFTTPTRFWDARRTRKEAPLAVDGVDLRVASGEIFGLLGPNGAGKTTLVKMLATLIEPSSGEARLFGFPLSQDRSIKAHIGLVTGDERSFFWRLTGSQNLAFFARLYGMDARTSQMRLATVIAQTGIESFAGKPYSQYSSGMRQRLALARALIHDPQLLFLDEPTRGLDPHAARDFRQLIRELQASHGLTVFLTTHNLAEADELCQHIAILHEGRLQAYGTIAELRRTLPLEDRFQLVVAGLSERHSQAIQDRYPHLQVETIPERSKANPLAAITFTLPVENSQPTLNQAIEAIQASGGELLAADRIHPSLDRLFTHFTAGQHRLVLPANAPPGQVTPSPQRDSSPRNKAWSPPSFWLAMRAFLVRDFLNEISYPFDFALQVLNILLSVGVFYFLAALVGDTVAPQLADYNGDYFAFVLIGIAFAGYFGMGLSSFAGRLRQAQTTGTLEAMLATPLPVSTLVMASALWDYLFTTLRVIIYLIAGGLLLESPLYLERGGEALVILALTITTFSGLGILAASFIMVLKRGDPVTWLFGAISALLGGIYYPIDVLPGWLQTISRLLPVTYAIDAMRQVLLQGASLAQISTQILALLIFTGLVLPTSLVAFNLAVRLARREGSLTQY